MNIAAGSTDQTVYFKLVDATGQPATGLTVTDLDMTYVRDRAAAVKADATALGSVDASHADNKIIEVDATNAPGLHRTDWPDAAFASGVDRVQLIVNGSAIDPAVIEVDLDSGAQLAKIGTGSATITAPVAESDDVTIVQGDDYDNDESVSLEWTCSDGTWPTDLTSATIEFGVIDGSNSQVLSTSGTVVTPTGTQKVRVELTDTQTAALSVMTQGRYQLRATMPSTGHKVSLATGRLTVQISPLEAS